MASIARISRAVVSTEPIWRLSVEQYHEMIQAGILGKDDQLELLEGLLIAKMTKNPAHSTVAYITREAIAEILPKGWHARGEQPVTTTDSEPEPDVMIVRGNPRDYLEHHPTPSEVALVIEVADSSLQRDQTLKKRIYARAGIPVYWLKNLIEHRIEVYINPYTDKESSNYRQRHDYGVEDDIPVVIGGKEIGLLAVKDLLP